VITGITASYRSLSVDFTQVNNDPNITITNYQYSTDNGATFRALSTPNVVSPLTITTLSSNGTTLLTNGQSYDVLIQAKTADGLGTVSNMVQGTPIFVGTTTQFTTVGSTTWTAPAGVTSVEYLVVGGGGGSGGGYDTGGGGGGGGGMVRKGTLSVTPGDVYNITVGDGGAGGISNRLALPETNGRSGQSSVFASIESLGGGRGYASRMPDPLSDPLPDPNPIANAGGISVLVDASGNPISDASGNLVASTGGSGGGSAGQPDFNGSGGGGGGSDSNGSNGIPSAGGNGGGGISSSISGSAVFYGVGGRGADGNKTSGNAGVAGASNTGNGARGGGATSSSDNDGAKGGSGIVILRYA
jgi:hypothetical protein